MATMMCELFNITKTALCADIQKEINKSNFSTFFTKLLEDCRVCVAQSLDSTVDLLCETNLNTNILIGYIEEVVCLLRLMSNFIKNVVESLSMSCCHMKSFPTSTGQILVTVFKHCKDSEQIYGRHLAKVGKQLKDLFRTCHELQITYLMILEKHFLFDLTENEEQDILINALEINLEIGEIVQGLDVKTLAEQWKAYTAMCEKYADYLMNKNVYSKCTQILCSMINTNIVNALEVGLDEKVLIRSLKVTSFIIKILLKVTNTFRNSTITKHVGILETLINIYINNESYLEFVGRSPQLINLVKSNVLSPTDVLVAELLQCESFVKAVFQYDITCQGKDEKVLGYIIFISTIMQLVLQEGVVVKVSPIKLVRCAFHCVPYCHIWFNMPLKFDGESINSESTYGLYEYLLTRTAAISLTLNSEEMCALEKLMCDHLLGTSCWNALFASNLWVLVARMISSQCFLVSQLISLCRIYQKLESQCLFKTSPQQIHLSATITRLFELLDRDNKNKVIRHFSPVYDEKNINLWIAMKINNVPWDVRNQFEEEVLVNCKMAMDKFFNSNLNNVETQNLIKLLNLLATFSITADKIEEHILKVWTRICLKNNISVSRGDMDKSTIWFLEFVQAITGLTNSVRNSLFVNPTNLVKVMHVISTLIQNGNTELKLCLIDPLCKFATFYKPDNKSTVESLASESFVILSQSDVLIKSKLFNKLNKLMSDVKMDKIISLTTNQDNLFRESWKSYLQNSKTNNFNKRNTIDQLKISMGINYRHRCLENESEMLSFKKDVEFNNCNFVQLERKSSDNFDFAEIDDIFDNDCDSEPNSKKMKYASETNDIVCRLENDTLSLYKIKENVFDVDTRRRLKNVCEKLKNIIE